MSVPPARLPRELAIARLQKEMETKRRLQELLRRREEERRRGKGGNGAAGESELDEREREIQLAQLHEAALDACKEQSYCAREMEMINFGKREREQQATASRADGPGPAAPRAVSARVPLPLPMAMV